MEGGRDLCAALFVSNLLLDLVGDSRRLLPELISFLHWLLRVGFGQEKGVGHGRHNATAIARLWTSSDADAEDEMSQIPLHSLWSENSDEFFASAAFARASLHAFSATFQRAIDIYSQIPSFIELFEPLCDTLGQLPDNQLKELRASLHERLDIARGLREPIVGFGGWTRAMVC
jgi:hypothetical protein